MSVEGIWGEVGSAVEGWVEGEAEGFMGTFSVICVRPSQIDDKGQASCSDRGDVWVYVCAQPRMESQLKKFKGQNRRTMIRKIRCWTGQTRHQSYQLPPTNLAEELTSERVF